MIPRTRNQRPGSMRLAFLIQKPPSPKTGMRTHRSRLLMRKLRNQATGLMTSQAAFLIRKLRSQKTGMTRKTETGFLPLCRIQSARKPPVAANGNLLRSRIQHTRASGLRHTSITQRTKAYGLQERFQIRIISRTRHPQTLSLWEL